MTVLKLDFRSDLLPAWDTDAPQYYQRWIDALQQVTSLPQLDVLVGTFRKRRTIRYVTQHRRTFASLADVWTEAALRTVRDTRGLRLGFSCLVLPPLFREYGWRATRTGEWRRLQDEMRSILRHPRASAQNRTNASLTLLFVDAMTDGIADALHRFVDNIAGQPVPFSAVTGMVLEECRWFSDLGGSLPAHVAQRVDLAAVPRGEVGERAAAWLNILGFSRRSDREWNDAVYRQVALPWLKQALQRGDINLALRLENRITKDYVRQTENEEHQRRCQEAWLPDMLAAGRRMRAALPPLSMPSSARSRPVVAFFVLSGDLLAHTEWLLSMLDGLRRLDFPPFDPRVYVFQPTVSELASRLAELNVPVTYVDRLAGADAWDWSRRLTRLREQLTRDGVSAAVFVSVPVLMPLAFAMGLAPVQIWWSMKYHTIQLPEIDAYFTVGSIGERERVIDGQRWRTLPPTLARPFDPRLKEEARRIRERLSRFDVILGSLNRPEKIDSPEYLDALQRILQAHPGAMFLWFGRYPHRSVQNAMMERRIHTQCLFSGWVDTRLYAQVLDVHLDAFPFPAGITSGQVMAAGVPSVTFLSKSAEQNGILAVLWPLWQGVSGTPEQQRVVRELLTDADGGPLFSVARSVDEYVAQANRLIDDPAFRRRSARAAQRLIEHFNEPTAMARGFAEHLREVISERAGGEAAHGG